MSRDAGLRMRTPKSRNGRIRTTVRCLGCQRMFRATGQHHNYCRRSCRLPGEDGPKSDSSTKKITCHGHCQLVVNARTIIKMKRKRRRSTSRRSQRIIILHGATCCRRAAARYSSAVDHMTGSWRRKLGVGHDERRYTFSGGLGRSTGRPVHTRKRGGSSGDRSLEDAAIADRNPSRAGSVR